MIGKLLENGTSAPNGVVHGVKSAFVVYVPHAVGVASAACAPPLKDSLKLVNGSAGCFLERRRQLSRRFVQVHVADSFT